MSLRCHCRVIRGRAGALGTGRLRTGDADAVIIEIWAPGASPDTDNTIYRASGDVEGGQVKNHRS